MRALNKFITVCFFNCMDFVFRFLIDSRPMMDFYPELVEIFFAHFSGDGSRKRVNSEQ